MLQVYHFYSHIKTIAKWDTTEGVYKNNRCMIQRSGNYRRRNTMRENITNRQKKEDKDAGEKKCIKETQVFIRLYRRKGMKHV